MSLTFPSWFRTCICRYSLCLGTVHVTETGLRSRSRLFSPESEWKRESIKFTDSDRLRAGSYFNTFSSHFLCGEVTVWLVVGLAGQKKDLAPISERCKQRAWDQALSKTSRDIAGGSHLGEPGAPPRSQRVKHCRLGAGSFPWPTLTSPGRWTLSSGQWHRLGVGGSSGLGCPKNTDHVGDGYVLDARDLLH